MTYRSLTQYTVSCNNTIRLISLLNNNPHPNSKIKIRTQIVINLSKPYLIGGDDLGNLLYTPLHNFQMKRKKIHSDFIRRIYYYELLKEVNVILTCSDDGRINCYEVIEENGLKFKFLFDLDFGIGINDFNNFTTPILYENNAGEFHIKGNKLNIEKEIFKIFLEKNLVIATFFGLRVYAHESNKKLMKSFPTPIYSISRINENLYAVGIEKGVSIIELSYPSLTLTVIKTFEIGTCFKILLMENKLFCSSNDIYEINIKTYNLKKYNLTTLTKEIFFDLAIKREIKSKEESLEFIDRVFTITENEFITLPIKTEEYILTNQEKLFCFENYKTILRCKNSIFNSKKLVLKFDKPVDLKIDEKIFVNEKVYSILGRELTNEEERKSIISKYEFVHKSTLSHEFNELAVFLIDKIFYIFFKGELVLFTECSEYNLIEVLDSKFFLIKRENVNYFLYVKKINENEEHNCLDLKKISNFLELKKYFIYFVEAKITEFAFIPIKERIGLLNEDFNGLKIKETKNVFKREIYTLKLLKNFLIENINPENKEKDTSILEKLILNTESEMKEKLITLLFKVIEEDAFYFDKILKYGSASKAEEYLREINNIPLVLNREDPEISNKEVSKKTINKSKKIDAKKLKEIFEKYLKEKDYKNSLRICEEVGIKGDIKNILKILNEK